MTRFAQGLFTRGNFVLNGQHQLTFNMIVLASRPSEFILGLSCCKSAIGGIIDFSSSRTDLIVDETPLALLSGPALIRLGNCNSKSACRKDGGHPLLAQSAKCVRARWASRGKTCWGSKELQCWQANTSASTPHGCVDLGLARDEGRLDIQACAADVL